MRTWTLASAAALLAVTLGASPAAAANTGAAAGKALLLVPLTLTNFQDLNFGTVIQSGTAGSVTETTAGGDATPGGGVITVPGSGAHQAIFYWAGTPSQSVTFSITNSPATLDDGNGNHVGVSLLYLSPTNATVGANGIVEVDAGGALLINANQTPGVYTNTFEVTANYN